MIISIYVQGFACLIAMEVFGNHVSNGPNSQIAYYYYLQFIIYEYAYLFFTLIS